MIRTSNTIFWSDLMLENAHHMGRAGVTILNTIVTSFQNWIGAMAGMTPSLAIQGLCCLPWYLRPYH